jgi:hypothetical protein
MKKPLLVFTVLLITIYYTVSAHSHGLITHIGQAQEIINRAKAGDPSVPPAIAAIITKSPETERAFRSGALDGDLLNFIPPKLLLDNPITSSPISGFDPNNLNRRTHQICSASIAGVLLKNAMRPGATDVEKAYAYGWALVHLPGDIIGHPFVNRYVGNDGQWGDKDPVKWDYEKSALSEANWSHINIEERFDGQVLSKFGFDEFQTTQGCYKITTFRP